MFKSNSFGLYVIMSLVLMTMNSCIVTKNIKSDEIALIKNKLQIISDIDRKSLNKIKLKLEELYQQKPTKWSLLNPRTWGGKYTVYDADLSDKTKNDFKNLLVNRKGFYRAKVDYISRSTNNGLEITYLIETGPQFFIDSLEYSSDDKAVLAIINADEQNRSIFMDKPLDADVFDVEKNRIVSLLQNNGYANFTKNYIEYRGDSTSSGGVAINVHIYPPAEDEMHQQYRVGDIHIYTDHLNGEYSAVQKSDTVAGIKYFARGNEFLVKPSGISNAIGLEKGAIYKKSMETKTYKRLTALSPYRFAIINSIVNEDSDSIINFDVFLTPRENKWSFDAGTNLFYSNFSQVGRNNLLGFNTTFNLENRNFLKRAYRYIIDLEGTFEFDFTDFPNIEPNIITFQINNSVEIPRNVERLNFAKFLNKINIIKDAAYEKFNNETTTELAVSYGYSDIFDLYLLNSVNASMSYNYQPNTRTRIRYNQSGFNYVNISIDSLFSEQFLVNNPLLELSFTDQLFTGIVLRDISYYRLTRETSKRTQWGFIGNFEISGLENYLINSVVNVFQGNSDYWSLGKVNFAKFIRIENDIRFYKKFRGKRLLAWRFNVGVAFPYGAADNIKSDGVVPFVKQYFVGGPNSLRAWRLRELGPGGFIEPLAVSSDVPPFQSGNFKLDMSVEYRFKLFWLMDGAVFLDAGNVWLLKDDTDNSVKTISSDFFNQIAIGTGWGLRFDLTYFILRFDMGYKLRNPFPDPETGSHNAFSSNAFPLGNVNFAINYPF